MSSIPHKKTLTIGLGAAVVLAIVAWRVGSGIRSPAQIAADTAAPAPSLITAPVELRTLATEVVVRGTVRYGSPQAVVLAASNLKTGSAIVNRPAKIGSELREGTLAMSTSGRPVFVLRGAEPMHRDLAPGAVGPDVRQLEEGLARIGFSPGSVDDRFDKSTSAAIGAWYRKAGWTPLGATDAQAEQLRVSQAAASAARDAVLQAKLTLQTASRGATAADISQARIDASAASDAVATATLDVTSARNKAAAAKDAAARARQTASLAQITGKRDAALAAADLASKQTALKAATDAQADAQFRVDHPPADTRAADLEALKSALRQATAAVPVARSLVDAKKSAQAAAEAALAAVVAGDAAALAKAQSDVSLAKSEVASAEAALASAIDAQADAQRRVDNPPTDTRAVEVEAAKITLRQATAAVPIAQNDVAAATQAVAAAKAAATAAAAQARSDARAAARDSGQAAAELLRARKALTSTRARSALAKGRVTILSGGGNTAVARQIVSAAESEANRTRGALNTLAARLDIQSPTGPIWPRCGPKRIAQA